VSRAVSGRSIVIAGLGILALDRWLKLIALNQHRIGHDSSFFTYFENDRLFGLIKFDQSAHLGISAVILSLIAGLMIFAKRRGALGLFRGGFFILLGGLGNFIDRIVYGPVIDYVRPHSLLPVFNLADVLIFTGMIVLIGTTMRVKSTKVDR